MAQLSVEEEGDELSVLVNPKILNGIILLTHSTLHEQYSSYTFGVLNKAGWIQTGLCPHTYHTTLSPSPRNRHEAAQAFALNAFPARGNVFFFEGSIPVCL